MRYKEVNHWCYLRLTSELKHACTATKLVAISPSEPLRRTALQHLDLQVVEKTLAWLTHGQTVWLCTVLSTFGSSPREPGAMMAALADGTHIGSLSGGCIEEHFLARLVDHHYQKPCEIIRYGAGSEHPKVELPCGGQLEVLVEKLEPSTHSLAHIDTLHKILVGHEPALRVIDLQRGAHHFAHDSGLGPKVQLAVTTIQVRIGPAARLIIAGVSSITPFCADFASTLGYEVIICDADEHALESLVLNAAQNVRLEAMFPGKYLQQAGNVHANTAVVAMTHDPRVDDFAMLEAIDTPAFYLGVMGSKLTSKKRATRLVEIGGLSAEQVKRIQMPIGLNLGSKTPAEIALAIVADILRVQRGIKRIEL